MLAKKKRWPPDPSKLSIGEDTRSLALKRSSRNSIRPAAHRPPVADEQRLAAVLTKLRRSSGSLQHMGVRHIVVFGSTARGEAAPDSDVDLAIDIDPKLEIDLFDLAGIVGAIRELLDMPVDVARFNRLIPGVARAVARDGICAF
ncbi:MAG: nucleotidyltransferase domain-containing protein [Proteobacteria bacterium]|nr:nucleotidyltransferase domain-containing protein [Pseudomonadota bacterium]MBI3498293.1 nucleotidyltransferase domain-containing protein [Pseudomonadota bacterium]